VSDKAKDLTAVIASDLGTGLAPETAAGQNKVIVSVAAAQDEICEGLSTLSAWKKLEAIRRDVSTDDRS
jgi:hypothetical protein